MRTPRDFENPLCASVGGDLWFPEKGNSFPETRAICARCSHLTDCAEWGIKYEAHGIWGGLNGRERQRIRSQRNIILEQPSVEEWLGNAQPRKSLE